MREPLASALDVVWRVPGMRGPLEVMATAAVGPQPGPYGDRLVNREETATVLMAMAAAWPWHEVGHATVLVWQSHLGSVRFDDAMATANLLIANDDRFPSVGRFRSELRNVVARRVRAERFQLAPPAGDRPDPATAAERLSELRARLAATGTEPGWKTDEKEDARDG